MDRDLDPSAARSARTTTRSATRRFATDNRRDEEAGIASLSVVVDQSVFNVDVPVRDDTITTARALIDTFTA